MIGFISTIIDLFLAWFSVLVLRKCLKACFNLLPKSHLGFAVWVSYFLYQVVLQIKSSFPPVLVLLLNALLILLLSCVSYESSFRRRCIFSILLCTIWMLVEIVLSTIFSIIGFHGYYVEFMGAFISKILMFTSATAVGQYLKRKGGYDVPVRYVLMLIFVPTGSIYIMHNVFLIGINTKKYQFFSVVTGILLLLINYIIFEVYDSLAENAEYQKKNLLFKQQLDLCDQQASEREKQNLKIRSLRHDMKNYLACLVW